jgi:DNA-binding CsgD family transcriptional regulator
VQVPVATRRFSDYTLWPDLAETAVQDAIPTESYGNFGLAAAEAARQPLLYLAPGFTADRAAAARAVSQALGDDRFTQAREEGQGLTLDDAVAYAARKGGGRKRPATGWASLTPAELEVVRLVSEGLRNDAIARRLFIAPGTVKVHLSHIFAKLGIATRAKLAAQAAAHDLTAR